MAAEGENTITNDSKSPDIILRKVLMPIDFSTHSKNALEYAVTIARQFNAELILLYVVEPTVYPHDFGFGHIGMTSLENELWSKGMRELQRLIDTKVGGQAIARAIVRIGKPYHEIIEVAIQESIDLIVIATRGHTEMEHILFGSTAEKVVRRAPCPVLTWRGKEETLK
ncbi:MAG: universal stress protein [Bacteroidota bacterium]